jgi:hypothetical protein
MLKFEKISRLNRFIDEITLHHQRHLMHYYVTHRRDQVFVTALMG